MELPIRKNWTKLIHTVKVSTANAHDRDALPHLLRGNETRAWGEQGYPRQTAVVHGVAPKAKGFSIRRYRSTAKQTSLKSRRLGTICRSAPRSSICSASSITFTGSVRPDNGAWRRTCTARSDGRAEESVHRPTTVARIAGNVPVETGKWASSKRNPAIWCGKSCRTSGSSRIPGIGLLP